MRHLLAPLAALALLALPAAAMAASSSTATATGNTVLRSGPGSSYHPVGRLEPGTSVYLAECTRDAVWCLVLFDGSEVGWARGSFLVGANAKLEVTGNQVSPDSWDN